MARHEQHHNLLGSPPQTRKEARQEQQCQKQGSPPPQTRKEPTQPWRGRQNPQARGSMRRSGRASAARGGIRRPAARGSMRWSEPQLTLASQRGLDGRDGLTINAGFSSLGVGSQRWLQLACMASLRGPSACSESPKVLSSVGMGSQRWLQLACMASAPGFKEALVFCARDYAGFRSLACSRFSSLVWRCLLACSRSG